MKYKYNHAVIYSNMNEKYCLKMYSTLIAQLVKNSPTMQETRVQSLGREDPLEEYS